MIINYYSYTVGFPIDYLTALLKYFDLEGAARVKGLQLLKYPSIMHVFSIANSCYVPPTALIVHSNAHIY